MLDDAGEVAIVSAVARFRHDAVCERERFQIGREQCDRELKWDVCLVN